jgi:hypothetical protein
MREAQEKYIYIYIYIYKDAFVSYSIHKFPDKFILHF